MLIHYFINMHIGFDPSCIFAVHIHKQGRIFAGFNEFGIDLSGNTFRTVFDTADPFIDFNTFYPSAGNKFARKRRR